MSIMGWMKNNKNKLIQKSKNQRHYKLVKYNTKCIVYYCCKYIIIIIYKSPNLKYIYVYCICILNILIFVLH